MRAVPRKVGLVFAGMAAAAALASPMAGQAEAATTKVKLQNDLTNSFNPPRLLTAPASGVTKMAEPSGAISRWVKTTTSGGFATYKVLANQTLCLTGRDLGVVTVEKCSLGSARQQWRLRSDRHLELKQNGLVASVNTFNKSGVVMATSANVVNQRWTELPA